MEQDTKKYLEDFIKLCYSRLEKGDSVHKNEFEGLDLFNEIIEELADLSNYAFLEYIKIRKLAEKKRQYLSQHDN